MDWQSSKRSLTESVEHMFENQVSCDIVFSVGSGSSRQIVPAHRFILSARSGVFAALLNNLRLTDRSPYKIPDVEPVAFNQMLRYMYTDKLSLPLETIPPLLHAASKFKIFGLLEECTDFLLNELCAENAFEFLIQARLNSLEELAEACLNFIAEYTVETLKTDDFLKIHVTDLNLILQRPDLRIKEIELFNSVLRWTKAMCRRQNLRINPHNQRLVLEDAVRHIRFPLMEPRDFATQVVQSGILTDGEINNVLSYFISKPKSKSFTSMFCTSPRQPRFCAS